ncbi:RNA polymerase sigma factor [Grimontia sp. NTOU-MAR1]|uniref:RNA polymerase sigma factor n=1 Tax=Grimontia sp. NTOU-MAR1 TaxID=3111011 RepID=UPI002DB8E992|nr:sigma-70 family RNA polymerase sigma factor [Grimontia sp. NTOU-MAR1]WRV98591.1 sigma-70 family RNA polymerase sigma factor [Grimontia sp. NTOU-MAR1]
MHSVDSTCIKNSEREQIARIQAGHPLARNYFDQLVASYLSPLHRRCMAWLGCPYDADDVLQETLVRSFRYIHAYRGEAAFRSWLYAIADNQCRSYLKKRATHCQRFVSDELQEEVGVEEKCPVTSDQGISDSVQSLAKTAQEILVLRFEHDLSLEEISNVLGLGLSATKMRLYRAIDAAEKHVLKNEEAMLATA